MERTFIPRPSYLKRIEPFIGKPVIKVLVGQRRVGKSFLLLEIRESLRARGVGDDSILSINMEQHEFAGIKTDGDLIGYVEARRKKKGTTYLFIDEIQEISDFEKALRSLLSGGQTDIFCTGSNAKILSGDLATYLGGRYVEIRVRALSFPEFLEFHGLEASPASLEKYFRFGGLPFLIHLPFEDQAVGDYLRSVYGAILFKDVVSRHGIRNVAFLERLTAFLADNTGNLLSAKRISDFLKSQKIRISPNIVLNYLAYLREAYLVHRVPRSDLAGKRIFEIGEKYYFEDLGLRHAIIGYRQTDIHKILENLVYNHLAGSGYDIAVGRVEDREVDFVCRRGGERLYVQAAYLIADEKTKEREFGNLLLVPDNYPKVVVSMDEMAGGDYKGVIHLKALDFLTRAW